MNRKEIIDGLKKYEEAHKFAAMFWRGRECMSADEAECPQRVQAAKDETLFREAAEMLAMDEFVIRGKSEKESHEGQAAGTPAEDTNKKIAEEIERVKERARDQAAIKTPGRGQYDCVQPACITYRCPRRNREKWKGWI